MIEKYAFDFIRADRQQLQIMLHLLLQLQIWHPREMRELGARGAGADSTIHLSTKSILWLQPFIFVSAQLTQPLPQIQIQIRMQIQIQILVLIPILDRLATAIWVGATNWSCQAAGWLEINWVVQLLLYFGPEYDITYWCEVMEMSCTSIEFNLVWIAAGPHQYNPLVKANHYCRHMYSRYSVIWHFPIVAHLHTGYKYFTNTSWPISENPNGTKVRCHHPLGESSSQLRPTQPCWRAPFSFPVGPLST